MDKVEIHQTKCPNNNTIYLRLRLTTVFEFILILDRVTTKSFPNNIKSYF